MHTAYIFKYTITMNKQKIPLAYAGIPVFQPLGIIPPTTGKTPNSKRIGHSNRSIVHF